jgi:hypothetical protein
MASSVVSGTRTGDARDTRPYRGALATSPGLGSWQPHRTTPTGRHRIDTLLTADRDFSRFTRLKTRNPL